MEEPKISEEPKTGVKIQQNNQSTINPNNINDNNAEYNKNPYTNSDNRPSGLSFLSRDLEVKKARESFDSVQENQMKTQEFDKPNPWSKIIFNPANEYSYYYHLKLFENLYFIY